MLALDGGGIRAAVTLGFLERLEAEVDALEGCPTRLGDWFDLIGGTSTGSIVATLLVLGYRVADIRALYWQLGPRIFRRRRAWIFGLNAKFDGRVLAGFVEGVLQGRTLDSPDFVTGLCIVTKRLDTGSSWAVVNNPRSIFWDDPPNRSYRGNRFLPVANLVRASTAAPSFFTPEPITVAEGHPPAVFIDGGLTPHNNPALTMVMTALIPSFGLCWPTGPENLLVVSIGTGSFRPTLSLAEARASSSLGLALKSLAAIVAENGQFALTLLSYFGETATPWAINSEIGDLAGVRPPGGELFRFVRYDIRLETAWLQAQLGRTFNEASVRHLRRMDQAGNLDTLIELARAAAPHQVSAAHLRGFALGTQAG